MSKSSMILGISGYSEDPLIQLFAVASTERNLLLKSVPFLACIFGFGSNWTIEQTHNNPLFPNRIYSINEIFYSVPQ